MIVGSAADTRERGRGRSVKEKIDSSQIRIRSLQLLYNTLFPLLSSPLARSQVSEVTTAILKAVAKNWESDYAVYYVAFSTTIGVVGLNTFHSNNILK